MAICGAVLLELRFGLVCAGYLALNTIGNVASTSPVERVAFGRGGQQDGHVGADFPGARGIQYSCRLICHLAASLFFTAVFIVKACW